MGKYRAINVDLNRDYRNDLNKNFTDIDADIKSLKGEVEKVDQETNDRIDKIIGGGFIESLESARDEANASSTNANTQANYARSQGDYSKSQGNYAKEQGDYSLAKGDYADEKAQLAEEAAVKAEQESTNLGQLKIAVVDATQSANLAFDKANTSSTNADEKALYAQQQGDYAKVQGDYAKDRGNIALNNATEAFIATNDAKQATTDALNAAELATTEANNLSELKDAVVSATSEAETQSLFAKMHGEYAQECAEFAQTQAIYAKQQGDYAKQIADEISTGSGVVSINGMTGIVELSADNVGALSPSEIGNTIPSFNEHGQVLDKSGNVVEGKVKSANSVQPDEDGNIVLTSDNINVNVENILSDEEYSIIGTSKDILPIIDSLKKSIQMGHTHYSIITIVNEPVKTIVTGNSEITFTDGVINLESDQTVNVYKFIFNLGNLGYKQEIIEVDSLGESGGRPSYPSIHESTLSEGYLVSNISTVLNRKADRSYVDSQISKMDIPSKISQLENDSSFATTNDIQLVNNKVEELSSVAVSGDYNDLDNKPLIPSKVSDLTNDSDFITTEDAQDKATAAKDAAIDWAKSLGLGSVAKIIYDDLNIVKETGFYYGSDSALNKPINGEGGNGWLIHQGYEENGISSQLYTTLSGSVYIRNQLWSDWQPWQELGSKFKGNIIVGTEDPIGGSDGDIYFKYKA